MGVFSTFQQLFGFSRNELKVVLFLALTFLAGLAIRWTKSLHDEPGEFDYSKEDSVFLERSQQFLLSRPSEDSTATRPRRKAKQQPEEKLKPNSIDINNASKDQLMRLPGIGEAYAERIILYRDDHGPFRSVEELGHVKGIGKKTIARLRPFVTINPKPPDPLPSP